MKRINEDHKEINSGKKKDDEGYMARIELDSIERSIKNLRKVIKSSDTQLPAWVQSKITRAADYIDSATEYLQSEEELNEVRRIGILNPNSPEAQINKDTNLRTSNEIAKKLNSTNPKSKVAKTKARNLGGTGAQLPNFNKEEISLVDQILSEMGCGCDKKKKKKLQSEAKDPKGPVQPYKTPEEIAKKHGVSLESIKAQLKMGMEVEKEHTSDETDARITALQHLDEVPNYYTKLKKVEAHNESKIVRDLFGNVSYEFIDLISADPIISEGKKKKDPCWNGYRKDPSKKDYGKDSCVKIDEAIMPQKNGHNMSVTLMWRAKYYNIQMFFPQLRIPNRREIADEASKVYPGCKVITYAPCAIQSNVPVIQVPDKKSKNYLMNNGTIGEETEKKPLEKPMRTPGERKKFKVYVKDPDTGNIVTVRFGDPNMEIRRDDPKRLKAFRDRHNCDSPEAKDKTTAKYWSCYQWRKGKKVED